MSTKKYTRIVSRADESSAFEDGDIDLTDQVVAQGVPPIFVGALPAAKWCTVSAELKLRQQSASGTEDTVGHHAPRRD